MAIWSKNSLIKAWMGMFAALSVAVCASPNPFKQVALSDFVANRIIMTHQVYIPDIATDQSAPRLTIHSDGLAILRYPAFMKKSGEYKYWLNDQELSELSKAILVNQSNQTNLNSFGKSVPQADGTIRMEVSSAEKYDIIRYSFTGNKAEFVPQIVVKQKGLNSSSNADLVSMLSALADTIYSTHQD